MRIPAKYDVPVAIDKIVRIVIGGDADIKCLPVGNSRNQGVIYFKCLVSQIDIDGTAAEAVVRNISRAK